MRILVTAKPKMYRETLALALHQYRPDNEVMLVSSDSLDGEVASYSPHLLVRNDNDGATPEVLNSTVYRIDVLYSDSMGARIVLDGRVREIEDISIDDLLSVVDEVEVLISENKVG